MVLLRLRRWHLRGRSGTAFSGNVGLGRYFTPANSVALSVGGSILNYSSSDDSASFDGEGVHVGGYASHMPESGFQAYAAGMVSWWPDAEIGRDYANGMGTAHSSGSTDGSGWGVAGWLGYALMTGANNVLTPFSGINHAESHFDAWSETGGPFPASFEAVDAATTDLRLGLKDDWEFVSGTTLYGSGAWVHRLDGDGTSVNGSLLAIGCTATPTPSATSPGTAAGSPTTGSKAPSALARVCRRPPSRASPRPSMPETAASPRSPGSSGSATRSERHSAGQTFLFSQTRGIAADSVRRPAPLLRQDFGGNCFGRFSKARRAKRVAERMSASPVSDRF